MAFRFPSRFDAVLNGRMHVLLYSIRLLMAVVLLCGVFVTQYEYGDIFNTWNHHLDVGSPSISNIVRIIERIKIVRKFLLLLLRRLSNSKLTLIWLFIAALFRIHYFIPQQRAVPRSQRIHFVETLN